MKKINENSNSKEISNSQKNLNINSNLNKISKENSQKNSQETPQAISLKNDILNLPDLPGVYQYFSKENKLLYVGKAKNLKKRVRSYFSFTNEIKANPKNSLRIQKMINEAAHIEFIVTPSEADALILENSFIKQLHPKYNILLRDDKTYPYIYIDFSKPFARPLSTRKLVKAPKIKYFGPFFKGVKELLNALYLVFPLRQKNECKKPCTFYQIKRCKAPCAGLISEEEYKKILDKAIEAILNPAILIKFLQSKMQILSENENYEEAAKVRDDIKTLKELEVKVQIDIAKCEDFEVFALACEKNLLSTIRFVVQNGKIISANNQLRRVNSEFELDKNEIYKQLILENFNADRPVLSNEIFVYESFDDLSLLSLSLSEKFGKKIYIKEPKLGEKRKICDIAYQNALQNIKNETRNSQIEDELKSYFELENSPLCIEIYDNSHLQGAASVGGCVCFENNKFNKTKYRKYHLKANNDFEQMNEVLRRRIRDFDKLPPPDLWLIDGGKALLDLAQKIVKESGANIDVMAIAKEKVDFKAHRAKGGALDKIHTIKGEFKLSKDDKKLQFLQKLRDEAHRYAISFHQNAKRKQDLQSSKLINLGISQGSLQKLLAFYGSFEKIYEADFNEICKLTNKSTAEKLLKFKENLKGRKNV